MAYRWIELNVWKVLDGHVEGGRYEPVSVRTDQIGMIADFGVGILGQPVIFQVIESRKEIIGLIRAAEPTL